MRLLIAVAMTLAVAVPSLAECPVPGVYSTTTGSMIGGRVSEAWCGDVGPGQPGNTQNAMSWDGATLSTQWHVWGMYIDAAGPSVSGSLDGSGNGVLTYTTNYDGGQFWLSGAFAWSAGGGDLTGSIGDYVVVATVTYIGNVAVGMTSNVSFNGTFEGCTGQDCYVDFAIANTIKIGEGGLPAGYPPYLCGATIGEWFDACCITMQVSCAIPVQDTTWGKIKSLYQ